MLWWNSEQRKQRKQNRLRAKVAKLEREYAALAERCRILEEENRFCGTVLARMRLHAETELAEVKRKLLNLGFQREEAKRDK